MKTLILMRHGKSSWDDPTLDDHDRSLNNRGVASAKALGDWLRERGYVPDTALVSTAQRTRETFDGLGATCKAQYLRGLYLAEPDEMLGALSKAQGDTVLMVGHNPGIGWLAQDLVAQPPQHDRFDDYPTGATLIARFAIEDWAALKRGAGETVAFVVPRDLME